MDSSSSSSSMSSSSSSSASSSSSSSSTSSSLTCQCKHEVFISFRGEDIRENFVSHLYSALCRKKIKAYVDEELERGDEISSSLLDAIEGSMISVIVFSQEYASSKWCLNELVRILECKNLKGQIVVPVFYHVSPYDVRHQTGSYGDAFVKHEKLFKEMPGKLQKWRAVLMEASHLSGHEATKIRPEAKLVDEIVKDILKKLEKSSIPSDSKGLIGLNSRIERIKSLLCMELLDFRILGIWGMGGVGKTTLAEAIFNQISSGYEGKYFVANVREKSEKGGGLELLEKEILSQVLEENVEIGGPNILQYTRERLQRIKVLIVLDDINKLGQLEYLVRGFDQFGPGSRIIVTTRDRRVLDEFGVDKIYEVQEFNYHESLKLFYKHTFRQNHRPRDLLELSKMVVDYAKGNPLALKILGCFFYEKSEQDWKNALHYLKQISNSGIHEVLKISYDGLNWEEKNIFLDIACFFKGEDKDHVMMILFDSYSIDYSLNVLIDKSLITISNNNLQMHDLLQEMGKEIVYNESCKEPGKRSRLWKSEEIYNVLKKNKGTESVECIFLDLSKIGNLDLKSGAFASMPNLRLLKFYSPEFFDPANMIPKVQLPQGLDYLSDELRYLHWHGYPLKKLPTNFSPENLVELNLPYSKVEQLWEDKKEAFKLKWIDLHDSQDFIRIPDSIQETPNLEKINLWNCTKLPYVPSAIQNFNNLHTLLLSGCRSLGCFPRNIHFRSLITLDLSGCINLTEFPQISGSVQKLYLRGTGIEEVPSSIGCLRKLEYLGLQNCQMLKSLSTSICKLKSLYLLQLQNCSRLRSLPEILEKMPSLDCIDLSFTAIKELPSSIDNLVGLTSLHLVGCTKLEKLPQNLGRLEYLENLHAGRSFILQLPLLDQGFGHPLEKLDLRGSNLENLPTSVKQLSQLKYLYLSNCTMLQSLPDLPTSLILLDASNCKRLKSLPELLSCQEELDADHNLEMPFERLFLLGLTMHAIDFIFTNCLELNQNAYNILADSQIRIQRMAIASLRLFFKKEFITAPQITICLPGSEIPDWFIYQTSGSYLTIHLPQHWCNRRLIGFALCAIIEHQDTSDTSEFEEVSDTGDSEFEEVSGTGTHEFEEGSHTFNLFGVSCHYHWVGMWPFYDRVCHLAASHADDFSIDSSHVLLGFDPCLHLRIPNEIHHISASFKFSICEKDVEDYQRNFKMKGCGVCPLYAHTSETQPNNFTLEFAATGEEECPECSEIKDSRNTGTAESFDESDEDQEVEPI